MIDRSEIFNPVEMGEVTLSNRILMAPLTRNRSHSDGTPKQLARTYYHQRSSAGLIFTEATQISAMAKGYLDTPGIYTEKHIEEWRGITDAVHSGGGLIFCQLWHVGRISHSSLLPDGRAPLAPSAIQADTKTFTANGFEKCSKPIAMTKEDINQTLRDYKIAAECAKKAGFDGVEIHSANGYLLDQFLQDGTNNRDDEYGGSIENRLRLLNEVIDVVSSVWPKTRIGVRLSPLGQAGDISDSDAEATFAAAYKAISEAHLAYMHVVEQFGGDDQSGERALIKRLRKHFTGFYIANGGYDKDSACKVIESGHADAVTFGRLFISNPDLPERFRLNAKLNTPNEKTFYGGGVEGYTDYPFLNKEREAA